MSQSNALKETASKAAHGYAEIAQTDIRGMPGVGGAPLRKPIP